MTDFDVDPFGKLILNRPPKRNRLWISQLPLECIEEIIENLIDDHKTLYSCMFVNRTWCRISIPILWRYPQNFDIEHQKFWTRIVKPILMCMNKETLKILKHLGCKIIKSIYSKSPLFNYVGYMQQLTYYDVCHLTEFILPNQDHVEDLHKFLMEKIYNLFFTKGTKFLYFGVPDVSIFHHREAKTRFSHLQILACELNTSPNFFYELSKYCKDIQQLLILIDEDCNKENLGLVTLIKAQRCLKYLRIRSIIWKSRRRICLPKLAEAIRMHVNTLTYFEISGYICIPSTTIGELKNLKTLVISIDAYSPQELKIMSFPKLEELEIHYDEYTPFNTYMEIITKTCGKLKRVFWQFMDFTYNLDINSYAQNVIKSCPNLRFVSIYIEQNLFDALEKILKSCKLLEGIDIQLKWGSDSSQTNRVFELLSRYSPKNLTTIVFDLTNCEVSPETLETFLQEWWGQKRKPLGLYVNMVDPSQEILDIVSWFKFKGIFKEFYYCDVMPFYEIESIRKTWRSDFPFKIISF
ncbi:hypothetical protein Glove_227g150 [Diversispora epigaea]|uniref:F-box domain-containing protein n=1 Tax=Diversispora epigaea TaxID=1348612 RepID=A0A397IEA0_9GLOM|nr:hypothetical protein Glove_227g150 [Diversispora epigaea]